MKLFDDSLRTASAHHAEAVRRYELGRTVVEFLAAVTFIIGSVFFFYESLIYAGTWMFLIGSVLFAVRPSIRLMLELHLARLPVPREFRPYGSEEVVETL
ncbi:YrhK family protein [Roseibium algae]|uniref:YrhK family protein n=1 Tax=Roseibium algae TaxID=3123038 RepID=A0ABU8TJN0_9HYPH